jgi:flagellar secretion chaperone FliS
MKLAYAQSYRQNSVQTASPGQLILMLLDGALRFMNRAVQGFELVDAIQRNETVHVNLVKTQAIIDELQGSLNFEVGGDFPRTMSSLYEFMRTQLRTANVKKDAAPVHIVVELLGDIRGAWSAMLTQQENQVAAPTAWVATAA